MCGASLANSGLGVVLAAGADVVDGAGVPLHLDLFLRAGFGGSGAVALARMRAVSVDCGDRVVGRRPTEIEIAADILVLAAAIVRALRRPDLAVPPSGMPNGLK